MNTPQNRFYLYVTHITPGVRTLRTSHLLCYITSHLNAYFMSHLLATSHLTSDNKQHHKVIKQQLQCLNMMSHSQLH